MRHRPLQTALRAYADEAAAALSADVADGAEVPFELAEAGGTARRSRTPLYCYRPLTGAFIRERLGRLAKLETYPPAARALTGLDGVDAYLRARGEQRVPRDDRDRADAALRVFLDRLFDGSSDFGLSAERFETIYAELETVVAARARTSSPRSSSGCPACGWRRPRWRSPTASSSARPTRCPRRPRTPCGSGRSATSPTRWPR
jgi:hypothetical protein